jgi:hypothetical protein
MERERFRDRAEAGRLLADRLRHYAGRDDVIVLALPRGGVPVGHEVARALGAPLGSCASSAYPATRSLRSATTRPTWRARGKEGVDGSSPPEGSAKVPLTGFLAFSFRSTCSVASASHGSARRCSFGLQGKGQPGCGMGWE